MNKAKRIPGEEGIWVLLIGDLFAFSVFFLIFAFYRGQHPDVFDQGRDALNKLIGLANTLILLTSSLAVAIGVRRVRDDKPGAPLMFRLALLLGVSFIALKLIEYGQKLKAGITPLSNDFFMYYFAFTGIHLSHVVIGSVALIVMSRQAAMRPPSASRTMIVECGGLFWHLVDLLWIVLFALFYVAGDSHG